MMTLQPKTDSTIKHDHNSRSPQHEAVLAPEDESCLEMVNQTVTAEPGIVGVEVDMDREQVAVDYDPDRVSADRVDRIVDRITPILQDHIQTCTLRLGHHGGRSCESCALLLEGRLRQIVGVRRATASFKGGALSIQYDGARVSPADLMHTVREFGVRVAPSAAELPLVGVAAEASEAESGRLQRAWHWLRSQNLEAIFVVITLIAMIVGQVAEVRELPLLSTAAFVIAYLTGGIFGLQAGLESLKDRTIDVDLLMVLAALGAAVVGAPFEGALLLFLFSLSNVLQDYAMDRTRNAIRSLMKLRPDQALIQRDGELIEMPVERVQVEDHFVVKPGDRIPLDGVIVSGQSEVDQASLTGESMPVPKEMGDTVLAGTINKNGSLEVRVSKTAQQSTIARLIKLVEEAHSEKAETQRFLDTAEQYYAMGVIAFTLLAIVVPIAFLGEGFDNAFYRAMTIMVAASPCALIISTPASILSAIGNGARKGILFKGGVHVEQAAGIKVIAFDKTGTLTQGEPQLTDVVVLPRPAEAGPERWQGGEDDLLILAAALEARSEHVLAQAVVRAAQNRDLSLPPVTAFQATAGTGVSGRVDGLHLRIGNLRYFETLDCVGLEAAEETVRRLQDEGKTAVVLAQLLDGEQTAYLLGVLALADQLRPDAAAAVAKLKALGVEHVAMLTGDNERVARAIAKEVGVDAFYADLMPEDKLGLIKKLEAEYGPVAMIGDGVNDAPALASATIGVAMGAAGTDVALETADVVLMSDDLHNIPYVIDLSRQTRKTLVVNLGFAMAMIALMIGAIFTTTFSLPAAVVGHEGGTVLVSLNGLRLLVYKGKV